MPDSVLKHTPSHNLKQPSAGATPCGGSKPPRFFPGRAVSTLVRAPSYENDSDDDARVRIVLFLYSTAKGNFTLRPGTKDARAEHVQGPSIVVVGARVPHAFYFSSSDRVVILLVEPRFVHETIVGKVPECTVIDLRALSRRDKAIVQLSEAFCALCRGDKHRTSLYVESISTVAATHVLHDICDGEASVARSGGLPNDALHRAIKYIEEHYAEDFDFDELARIAGFARNQFQKLFKESLNQTPRNYLRGRQVEQAIVLLQTTDLKGLDIALACGFCDETQMARWFRKLRGRLPSEVRDAARA